MSDPRPAELKQQAHEHAEKAREKMDDRRSNASGGISGWVAERSGRVVDGRTRREHDAASQVRVERPGRPLVPDGDGRLGERPRAADAAGRHPLRRAVRVGRLDGRRAVVASVRRGAPDARHGPRRADGRARWSGATSVPWACFPAAPDSIATALAEGRDVALWPGGEVDSLRPWSERDQATLAGRAGFVKMAIRAGVPIVPIATVGGADAMPVLIRGDRLARTAPSGQDAASQGVPDRVSRCRGASRRPHCPRSRCPPRSAPV